MGTTAYDYAWILAKLKWLLNFNEGQVDQNYRGPSADTDKHLREAINHAYRVEVEEAQLETVREHWFRVTDAIWKSSAITFQLPEPMQDMKNIVMIRDVTDQDDGPELDVGPYVEDFEVFRKDSSTLQWNLTGPERDTTLRFTYLAEPEELKDTGQRPDLIPQRYVMLIVYTAGIFCRSVAEDKAPQQWEKDRDELRSMFHKSISRGWPMNNNPPVIRNRDNSM